ncbi:MAG: DUF5985 family protein [Rhodospirillaceae bacterium]
MTFPSAIYLLCAVTSLICLFLLARGYARTGVRLLLWSSICFVGLALNNFLLFVDLVLLPEEINLALWRQLTSLVAIGVLLYGFIWEAD